jgi:hypothetical protein
MNPEPSQPAPRFNLRAWATPTVLGALVISSVTGALLFFEADSGFAKLAHEWLGWVLVLGAIAHAYTNRASLRAHLSGARGRVVVTAFVLTTIAVIVPWSSGGGGRGRGRGRGGNVEGAGEGGGMLAAEYTLTHVSLDRLAPLAGREVGELVDRLEGAGFSGVSAEASIHDFAHGGGERDRALGVVFSPE